MADNLEVTPGTGATVGADEISGVKYQRIKIIHGADSTNDGDVSNINGLPTKDAGSATGTLANVASSATSVTLLASNTARRGAIIHNDSTQILYIKYGSTASVTSYTYKLYPDDAWEMPAPVYTGIITGIWASANGNARTTELT